MGSTLSEFRKKVVLLIQSTYLTKRTTKQQPISATTEAVITTTLTLPARLTKKPKPPPTRIWASCTMQVRAAQSRPCPLPQLVSRSASWAWCLCKENRETVFDLNQTSLHGKKWNNIFWNESLPQLLKSALFGDKAATIHKWINILI